MRFHILAILLLLLLPFSSAAQGRLVGRVSDSEHPLEYVNVGITSLDHPTGDITDRLGNYALSVPTADSITVRFSITGYQPQEFRLRIPSGATLTLDVVMRKGTMLSEVEVSSEKSRKTTFTQISVEKLESTVGPTGGVESLLKTLPDVASNNELSSQYNVRGGSFDENLVYINDVEIYRPMLIRSSQQEGLSIISPDLVDHILFSPGGFDCSYGDRMSSVLDITYSRPTEFHAKGSLSLLGATASVKGLLGDRFTYSAAFRKHTNQYVFRSLDTKGDYTSDYSDLQAILSYRFSDQLSASYLGVYTHNDYGLVPTDRSTDFGNMMEQLRLDCYFDGQEIDSYSTLLHALTFDYRPSDDWQIRWINSLQSSGEQENYDIQCQYWLRQVNVGSLTDTTFDRGVGTFLEHARNAVHTAIASSELKATRFAALGAWNLGLKYQYDRISAAIREWTLIDSAGYSVPTQLPSWGDPANMPTPPILQSFCHASNLVAIQRLSAYLQREINYNTRSNTDLSFLVGLRGQYYSIAFPELDSANNNGLLLSPRISASAKPNWQRDILFRLAAGIYHQAPFYREFQYPDGALNTHILPQHSYQATGTMDYNFLILDKPFKLTADIYGKYITNLITYTVDNMRIRYDADNDAVGYAAGVSLRLNGEIVDGLESWASLSLMKAQEDYLNDNRGWIDRPTDQRFSFKLFLQDYIPDVPYWRMNLTLIASDGLPTLRHSSTGARNLTRLPAYYRIDWGNTIHLSKLQRCQHWKIFRHISDLMLGVEVFNLFDYHNAVSYLWVADIENQYHAVPNYLTGRQINIKLTAEL